MIDCFCFTNLILKLLTFLRTLLSFNSGLKDASPLPTRKTVKDQEFSLLEIVLVINRNRSVPPKYSKSTATEL